MFTENPRLQYETVYPRRVTETRLSKAPMGLIGGKEKVILLGGFGEGVLSTLQRKCVNVDTMLMGVPDRFIGHGSISQQTTECGLNSYEMANRILKRWMERKTDNQ